MNANKRQRGRDIAIALIGPGRLGQALGSLLVGAGFPVRYVVARRLAAAREGAHFIGCGEAVKLSAAASELMKASVVLLTVSDGCLPQLARTLSRSSVRLAGVSRARRGTQGAQDWSGKVVLHTCGSLPSSVLQPLKLRGAAIGSLHPFQTVPTPEAGVRNLTGCFWGIEGDSRALEVAAGWVKALGAVAFRVRPSQKSTYHLAAFLVCPTVVTLMERSRHLLERAGVPSRVTRPMLRQFVAETARNFAELGARRALTGPAVRGDWPTIRRHLEVLRRLAPEMLPVYRALLRAMVPLGSGK